MKSSAPAVFGVVVVLGLGLSCYALPVLAQGNIRIGRIKVTPKIAYTGEYNDNIYLEKDNAKSDYINTVAPALRLSFAGKPGNYVKAGYEVDLVHYNNYNDNNYQSHKVSGGFGFKSPRGFYLTLRERYTETANAYGSAELYKEGERTKRWSNTVGATVGYEFAGRFTLEGDYQSFVEEYDLLADQWQDKQDHAYSVKFYYRFLPKTSAVVQHRRTVRDYPSQARANDNDKGITSSTSEDYTIDDYFVGLHWDPSARLNGELKLGHSKNRYDNELDWNNNRYEDKDTWVVESNLSYRASEKTKLRAKVMRSIKESTSTTSNYYTDTTFGLGINQALVHRVYFDLGLDYNRGEYNAYGSAGNRDDKSIGSTLSLDYNIQPWLSAGLAYAYKRRYSTSGFEDKEYTNHKWMFNVNAEF